MSQVLFYATGEDLRAILAEVEAKAALSYIAMGSSFEPTIVRHPGAHQLPSLGLATAESASNCRQYLVVGEGVGVAPREIRQSNGVVRFVMDQLLNPDSVVFNPGGIWKGDVLLHGSIGTASASDASLRLMRKFQGAIRRHTLRVRAYRVGPEAMAMLKSGRRLTIAAQSPREFDLKDEPNGKNTVPPHR